MLQSGTEYFLRDDSSSDYDLTDLTIKRYEHTANLERLEKKLEQGNRKKQDRYIDVAIIEEDDLSSYDIPVLKTKYVITDAVAADDDDAIAAKQALLKVEYALSVKRHSAMLTNLERINADLLQIYIKRKREQTILAKFEAKAANIIFAGASNFAFVGAVWLIGPSAITWIISNIAFVQNSALRVVIRGALESFLGLSPADLLHYDKLIESLAESATGKDLYAAFKGKNPLLQSFSSSDLLNPAENGVYQTSVLALGNFLLEKSTPPWMKTINLVFGKHTMKSVDIAKVGEGVLGDIYGSVEKTVGRSILRKIPLYVGKTDAELDSILTTMKSSHAAFSSVGSRFKQFSFLIKDVYAMSNSRVYADPKFIDTRLKQTFNGLKYNSTFRNSFRSLFIPSDSGIKGNFQLFYDGGKICLGFLTDLLYDSITDTVASNLQHLSSNIISPLLRDSGDDNDDNRERKKEKIEEYKQGLRDTRLALVKAGGKGESIAEELKRLAIINRPDYVFDSKDMNVVEHAWRSLSKKYKELTDDGIINTGFLWFGVSILTSATGELINNTIPRKDEIGSYRDYFNLFTEPYVNYIRDLAKSQATDYFKKYIERDFLQELERIYEQSLDVYVRKPIMESDYYRKVAEWGKSGKEQLIAWINKRIYLGAYINGVLGPLIDFIFGYVSRFATEPVPQLLQPVHIGIRTLSLVPIFDRITESITKENMLSIYNGWSRLTLRGDAHSGLVLLGNQLLKLQPNAFTDIANFTVKEATSFEEAMDYDLKGDDGVALDLAYEELVKQQRELWNSSLVGFDVFIKTVEGQLRKQAAALVLSAKRIADSTLYNSIPHGKRYSVNSAKIKLPGGGVFNLKGDAIKEYYKEFQNITFAGTVVAYLKSNNLNPEDLTDSLLKSIASQANFSMNQDVSIIVEESRRLFTDSSVEDRIRQELLLLNKKYIGDRDFGAEYISIGGQTYNVRAASVGTVGLLEDLFGYSIEPVSVVPDESKVRKVASFAAYYDLKMRDLFKDDYLDAFLAKPSNSDMTLGVSTSGGFAFYNNIKSAEDTYYTEFALSNMRYFLFDDVNENGLLRLEQAIKINPQLGKIVFNILKTEKEGGDTSIYYEALRSSMPPDLFSVINSERIQTIDRLLGRTNSVERTLSSILTKLPVVLGGQVVDLSEISALLNDLTADDPYRVPLLNAISILEGGDISKEDLRGLRYSLSALLEEIQIYKGGLKGAKSHFSDLTDFLQYVNVCF